MQTKDALKRHLDGARVFNAAVALGVQVSDIARHFDTVSMCLSKGLAAPIGSVLVGDAETISRARRWRKMVGGGMRQAGVIAAACIYALQNNIERLADDHAKAARVAEALNGIDGFRLAGAPQTNMLFLHEEMPLDALTAHLRDAGIQIRSVGSPRLPRWMDSAYRREAPRSARIRSPSGENFGYR